MALNANNGGSDGVLRIKPPPAPRAHTTGAQNSEYSELPGWVVDLCTVGGVCAQPDSLHGVRLSRFLCMRVVRGRG